VGRLNPELRSSVSRTADPTPRTIRDQLLTGRVTLDNARFEKCRFQGAVLVYSGGAPPHIQDCSFKDVSFEFEGAAGRTLALLQAMSAGASGLREVFKASFPKMFGH